MRISSALPAGVTALLFEEAARRRKYEERAVRVLEAAGFSEIVLPILDYFEPYEALLANETREELYRFVDRDGELLALRGDFTPMLARLLAPRLGSMELPLRVFYRGDLVRYQEERPGRLREYYELGAELLGAAGDAADEEMLLKFLETLLEGGRRGLRVILGLAGALDGLLLAADEDPTELARGVARRERQVARRGGRALVEVVENGVPERSESLGESADHLARLVALRDRMQSRFDPSTVALTVDLAEFAEDFVDARLVERAAHRPYYDGIVFHAYLEEGGPSVGRGGRYDRLFRRLGADLPAVGCSVSVDRLLRGGRE